MEIFVTSAVREKCPYSELFWSAFSRVQTEYGEILRISPQSVWMRENVDQNNSEYGYFSRSATYQVSCIWQESSAFHVYFETPYTF